MYKLASNIVIILNIIPYLLHFYINGDFITFLAFPMLLPLLNTYLELSDNIMTTSTMSILPIHLEHKFINFELNYILPF
jgi:hypothetical protein